MKSEAKSLPQEGGIDIKMGADNQAIALLDTTKRLAFHPLANVLPLMEGTELAEFVQSIKNDGLRHPIVLFEGVILDGRNRYLACLKAGIEPRFEQFAGDNPVAFVRDENIMRRNLTIPQRAIALAEFSTYESGLSKTKALTKQTLEERGPVGPRLPLTRDEAAKKANVSKQSIRRAKAILAHGTEDEKAAVRAGRASLSAVAERINKRAKGIATVSLPTEPRKRNVENLGARLRVPGRERSASEWCRRGMALEKNGLTTEQCAEQIEMSIQTFRSARDIVLLSDRADDLNESDRKVAQEALRILDEERCVSRAYQLVLPLVRKVWGGRGQRGRKTELRRQRTFDHAVAIVSELCERLEVMEVPLLPSDDARKATTSLRLCQSQLQTLIRRVNRK